MKFPQVWDCSLMLCLELFNLESCFPIVLHNLFVLLKNIYKKFVFRKIKVKGNKS